nr:haloacid dehalogenase-like hydrolase [Tsuneonella aeria]
MRIAIYDLDRTLTRRATFTPFLLYAAWHRAPWRLALSPVWVAAMAGYRMGLCSRTALKRFGMRLMLGDTAVAELERMGARFARRRVERGGMAPGALRSLETERKAGAKIVIATAAFAFYAKGFAKELGIEHLVGTDWDGQRIPGGNCYGRVKRERFEAWLADSAADDVGADIAFYSDSLADGPLFARATEPVLVVSSDREKRRARGRGWKGEIVNWAR